LRTENEFNARLTRDIRKLGTTYKAIKMSDRFKIGVPDWLMFYEGRAVAVEAKFIQKIPARRKVLSHPVTGPQISYMKSLTLAGVPCKVIIGAAFDDLVRVVDLEDLPEDGNFSVEQFALITETGSCKMSETGIFMQRLFGP